MCGIEPVYRRPAVSSVIYVRGEPLFSRHVDENWYKPVIAISVDGWCETHYGHINAAVSHCPPGLFRSYAWVRVRRNGHGFLSGDLCRRQKTDPGGDDQRASRSSKHRTQGLNRSSIVLAVLLEFGKIMIKTGMNHAIRIGSSLSQTLHVLKIASMDVGASTRKLLGSRVRSGKSEHLMPAGNQIRNDSRTN